VKGFFQKLEGLHEPVKDVEGSHFISPVEGPPPGDMETSHSVSSFFEDNREETTL